MAKTVALTVYLFQQTQNLRPRQWACYKGKEMRTGSRQPCPSGVQRQRAGTKKKKKKESNQSKSKTRNRSSRPKGPGSDFGEKLYSSRLTNLRARYPMLSTLQELIILFCYIHCSRGMILENFNDDNSLNSSI